jgi:hypothetical protein
MKSILNKEVDTLKIKQYLLCKICYPFISVKVLTNINDNRANIIKTEFIIT